MATAFVLAATPLRKHVSPWVINGMFYRPQQQCDQYCNSTGS